MKRVAVIGGGIAGLSAAYTLAKQRRAGAILDYVLFERSPRLGGVLVTDHADGCIIEAGPDSFVTEKPWATALARELGLADQIIGSNDADRKTYIVVKNRLVELPDGLMFMVPTKILPTLFSPLFTVPTKLRMAAELLFPPHKANGDESVAAMVERHFGPEMVDRLADPLLSGIYGGECRNLSARAVLPRFVDMETREGSLTRAMLKSRKRMAEMRNGKPAPPLFTSLKGGMQQLVDSVLAQIDSANIRTQSPIATIARSADQWTVVAADGTQYLFDAVILATPAHCMASLLQAEHPDLAGELASIRYSSSVTCTLIYDKAGLAGKDRGFGFLVPRSEGRRLLAGTFVHNKFPHRAPSQKGIIRAFLGGANDQTVLDWSDDQILDTVRKELHDILGLESAPSAVRIYRWHRCMAQPSPGHLDRLNRIETLRRQLPGLALAGNAFHGIGVPDCVHTGIMAAEQVVNS